MAPIFFLCAALLRSCPPWFNLFSVLRFRKAKAAHCAASRLWRTLCCWLQVPGWAGARCIALRPSSTTRRTMCCCRTSAPSACAAGTLARPRGRTCCRWATTTLCAASCTRPPTPASWPAATTSGPASGTAAPPRTEHGETRLSLFYIFTSWLYLVTGEKKTGSWSFLPW